MRRSCYLIGKASTKYLGHVSNYVLVSLIVHFFVSPCPTFAYSLRSTIIIMHRWLKSRGMGIGLLTLSDIYIDSLRANISGVPDPPAAEG